MKSNKQLLRSISFAVIVVAILLSGCVGDESAGYDMSGVDSDDIVVVEEVLGFDHLGTSAMSMDRVSSHYGVEPSGFVDAAEAFYQDGNGVDFYVHAVEFESSDYAEDFVQEYKATFRPLATGDRFLEESLNGHDATRITTYSTFNGDQLPRYRYIWNNQHFVIFVSGNTADHTAVSSLAKATGY